MQGLVRCHPHSGLVHNLRCTCSTNTPGVSTIAPNPRILGECSLCCPDWCCQWISSHQHPQQFTAILWASDPSWHTFMIFRAVVSCLGCSDFFQNRVCAVSCFQWKTEIHTQMRIDLANLSFFAIGGYFQNSLKLFPLLPKNLPELNERWCPLIFPANAISDGGGSG